MLQYSRAIVSDLMALNSVSDLTVTSDGRDGAGGAVVAGSAGAVMDAENAAPNTADRAGPLVVKGRHCGEGGEVAIDFGHLVGDGAAYDVSRRFLAALQVCGRAAGRAGDLSTLEAGCQGAEIGACGAEEERRAARGRRVVARRSSAGPRRRVVCGRLLRLSW